MRHKKSYNPKPSSIKAKINKKEAAQKLERLPY